MKKIIATVAALIFAMEVVAGCESASREQSTSQEVNSSYTAKEETIGKAKRDRLVDKALKLEKENGVMSVGEKEFYAKEDILDLIFPEEITAHDQGVFFSDVYDYDGDGSPELFILRRQEGVVECESSAGNAYELERSEYVFEMYEYSEKDNCSLSSRFLVGVTDSFNAFISHTSMSVFRKELGTGADIFFGNYYELPGSSRRHLPFKASI